MKILRLLLLVLLAALLPFRGALAEVAHCAGDAPSQAHHHASDAGPAGGVPAWVADAGADASASAHDEEPDGAGAVIAASGTEGAASPADPCNLCTSSCSTTPFTSALPSVASPTSWTTAGFPALVAPPASHSSEGQERPPRLL